MNPKGIGIRSGPRWRRQDQLHAALPGPVRGWLLDDGSLTQHLIDTGRRFSLQRWQQRWERPRDDERRALDLPRRERAMVRHVVLRLDEQPVVFARSVFPASSLTGPLLRLRRLADQSLGALLFARSDMRRSPFELAYLHGGSEYLPQQLRQPEPVWARRSCFQVAQRRLLVSEVFLPGFPCWSATMPLHRSRRGLVSASIGGSRN